MVVAGNTTTRFSRRYHESNSSFVALARQSSELSQAPTVLFDQDHLPTTGKGSYSLVFSDIKPERLATLRSQLGLEEWESIGEEEV